MNVVSQIFGLAMNLFMVPNTLINSIVNYDCSSIKFKMGENELKVALVPRGFCSNCCPVRPGIDIRFVLYNKQHPDKGIDIKCNQVGAARQVGVNREATTVIFVHGFTEPSPGQSGREIINAYLTLSEPVNVILLDWSEMGTFPWYRSAALNVKYVAENLKTFLETFHDSGEIPIEKVHIIGFSLGSHIGGLTGRRLRKGLRLPRITALDPALPEFSDPSRRLTQTDAEFVDVIHTDAGVFGLPFPVGHADFYPNGGISLQPGCQPSYLAQYRLLDQIFACSHIRAWKLYAESVENARAFPATKCRNWRGPNRRCNFTHDTYMGYATNKKSRGQFYLLTGPQKPYTKTVNQQL